MENTLLYLEEKCLLLLKDQNNGIEFFCNGFNSLRALYLLPEMKKINVEKMSLELGEGDSYKHLTEKDFKKIEDFSDVKNIFGSLPPEVFIYDLRLSSEKLNVSIYDNREFTLSSVLINVDDMLRIAKLLILKSFLFSEETCLQIINALVENNNKYLLINEKGDILNIYENFDAYLSANQ